MLEAPECLYMQSAQIVAVVVVVVVAAAAMFLLSFVMNELLFLAIYICSQA